MSNRKAQITIYIFIGIILLFSIVAIYFFKSKQADVNKIPEITEEIPNELQPIRSFVEDCVERTSIEAIEMIGMHGGFIGLDTDYRKYTSTSFKLDPTGMNPTDYDAVSVSPEWKIPYWWYLKSPNKCSGDCAFSTLRPPLKRSGGDNSIEDQIDRYVNLNLPICLNNFKSFNEKGLTIINTSGIKTTTTIAERDVAVFVEFPLEVQWSGGKSTVSQFSARIDVNLLDVYNLATEIVNIEQRSSFLEKHTLNLIAAYSGIDESKLPPMAGTDLSFSSKIWRMTDVKRKLQDILAVYINALQTTRTNRYSLPYFEDDAIKTGLYAQMVVALDQTAASNPSTDVSFNYLGWPIYAYITNSEIVRAKDSVAIPILSAIMPIQRYDLPYDVSFPVMVSITDPTAMKGKGYNFFFALESNIRNNQPLTVDFVGLSQASAYGSSTQICSENQRISEDVIVRTADSLGNPVPGVSVLLSVGDVACSMGETKMEGDEAIFSGKFPTGAIGSLVLMHPDYGTYTKPYFRGKDTMQDLGVIKLDKYIVKNVSIAKMNIRKSVDPFDFDSSSGAGWMLIPLKLPLSNNEHAIVMLEKIKESPAEDDVMAAANLNNTINPTSQMRLVPGRYKMRVTLIQDNATIKIPEDEICDEDWTGHEECETIPEVILSNNAPFMPGDYELEVRLTNSIYLDNIIEFTALSFDLLGTPENQRKHKDLEDWSKVQDTANQDRELLLPVLRDLNYYANNPYNPVTMPGPSFVP